MNVPISKVKLILSNKSDETYLLVKNSLNERYTLPEATVRFGEGIIDCMLRILHKKLNFPDIEENLFFDVILDQDLSKDTSIHNNNNEFRQMNDSEYKDSLLKNKKSFLDFFSRKKRKKSKKTNVSLYGVFEHYETDKTITKSINDLFNENLVDTPGASFLQRRALLDESAREDTEISTSQDFHTINYLIKIELDDSVIFSNQNDRNIQSSLNEEYRYIRYNTISEIKKLLNLKISGDILDSNLDIYFKEKRKNELSEVLDTLII